MIQTLKTNWRDLVAFLALGLGLVALAGGIDFLAGLLGGNVFLPYLSNYLQGIARFVGATFAVSFLGIAAWPTINRYANHSFSEGWEAMPPWGKFVVYVALFAALHISASISFQP